ncbi:S41 family peptidase [Microlunatus endophyticus]
MSDQLVQLRKLINDNYVCPDAANTITEGLVELMIPDDPARAAVILTDHLQRINHDRHLRVRRRPPGATVQDDDLDGRYVVQARENAGGVRAVTRLDAETGLLTIAPYLSPVHLAEPYLVAAFGLLTGVTRLIIDLRAGLGGTPETVAFVCGYLLGDEPVYLQDVVDRDGRARQFWSVPAANRLADDARIVVLTSSRTFSGCEELAYNLQALGRATIIGETTGGGAHPCEVFGLTDDLEVTIPVARSRNAVTGNNWEQVGVVPDIACPAERALEVARQTDR